MASDRLVEQQILDALASGGLRPTRGVGEPFEKLDNDPAWWAKALLRREQSANRIADVNADRNARIAKAVAAEGLADARTIVASLNRDLAAWNANMEEEHQLELVDEIWLLTQRESARR